MSVQSEIERLSNAKADIASAIAEKGIEVPVGTTIDEMADLIRLIKAGSSVSDEILLTMANVDPTVFVVSGGTVSFNYLPGTTLIVWGDGEMEEFDPSMLTKDNIVTHTYATTGIYTVKVYNAQTIPKYFAMAMSNGMPTVYSPTWLLEAKIGDTVTTMEEYAFGSCSKLYKFEFGAGVTTLLHALFNTCLSLTEVTVPSCVTKIHGFGSGGNLKQVFFNNKTPPTPDFSSCSGNPFSGGYAIVPKEFLSTYKNTWYISYVASFTRETS